MSKLVDDQLSAKTMVRNIFWPYLIRWLVHELHCIFKTNSQLETDWLLLTTLCFAHKLLVHYPPPYNSPYFQHTTENPSCTNTTAYLARNRHTSSHMVALQCKEKQIGISLLVSNALRFKETTNAHHQW